MAEATRTIKLFYCYAHEDKELRDKLEKHLGALRRLGQIVGWYDREIQAGTEWEHEIDAQISTSSIILLLVSADFISSDYCYSVEMQKALELHRIGHSRVIPILLRLVDWQGTPIATLQMLPTGAKPITSWANQDEAFEDIARNIRAVVITLLTPIEQSKRQVVSTGQDIFERQRSSVGEENRNSSVAPKCSDCGNPVRPNWLYCRNCAYKNPRR